MQPKRKTHEGIEVRHSRSCASKTGGSCTCEPGYQASVWSRREKKRIRKTFRTVAAAKAWRHDSAGAVRRGEMKAPTKRTFDQAAAAFLVAVETGEMTNRSGDAYKPSAIRGYRSALNKHVLPELGHLRLSEIERHDLQRLVDSLRRQMSPSTLRNALMPVRVIFRRAVRDGEITINPTANLELPAVRGRRERIATAEEASQLIATLPVELQALWATALYAGLRLGELRALDWENVDLANGKLRVEQSWDAREGLIETKNRGKRTVPIAAALRDLLVVHRMRLGEPEGFVFGRSPDHPFNDKAVRRETRGAWDAAELAPIDLHEARHTFASLMIAAGVNAKALSEYMGHSSIKITLDLYGHLMPGNEEEAAGLLDAYLERANTQARLAQVG
jgi:integrase